MIKSLIKKNPEERLTWNEYINHNFFKGGIKNTDYEYEIVKEIKVGYNVDKIIVLKDNTIITEINIITNDYKIICFDKIISKNFYLI